MYGVFRGWAWCFSPRSAGSAWMDLKKSNAKTGESGGPAIYPRSNRGYFGTQKVPEDLGPGRAGPAGPGRAGPGRPGRAGPGRAGPCRVVPGQPSPLTFLAIFGDPPPQRHSKTQGT